MSVKVSNITLGRETKREDLGAPGEIVVGKFAFKTVLMHDPVGFFTLGSSTAVKNQSLLHPNERAGLGAVNLPVLSGGFPVPGFSCPVGSEPRRVFPVTQAEKVPLFLPHLCLVCKFIQNQRLNTNYNQHPTFIN